MALLRSLGGVFWNPRQRRLRMVWRLAGFGVLLLLCTATFDLAWRVLGLDRWVPGWVPFSAGSAASALALFAATLLAAVLLDRRPWPDLGFHLNGQWWADLGFGLALGAGLMLLIFVVEWMLGWITVVGAWRTTDPGGSFWRGLLTPLAIFLYVGFYEELISRGYLLRNLAEGLNLSPVRPTVALVLAWLLSSFLFGLAHAANPNSSWVSTLYLMLGGLFLGLGYVLTGELAIPVGVHITWNFFQGVVLGFPVSGIDFSQTTFVAIRQGGPAVWTGGTFGPEAGLLGVLADLLGCLLIVLWLRRRQGMVRLQGSLAQYQKKEPQTAT